jgi:hypothetical protein
MRQQSRQPGIGPVGRIKGILSQNIYSKGELSQTTALSLTEQRARGSSPERNTMAYYCSGWCLQMGDVEDGGDDDEWEPVDPITSPYDSVSGYWGLSAKKSVFNRLPTACTAGGGGSVLTQHQSCDTEMDRKRNTLNGRLTRHTARNFTFLQVNTVHQIFFNNYFGSGEDD